MKAIFDIFQMENRLPLLRFQWYLSYSIHNSSNLASKDVSLDRMVHLINWRCIFHRLETTKLKQGNESFVQHVIRKNHPLL